VELKRIAIDTSKHVFTLHGVDERERPILQRNLKREQVEAFFAKQPPTEVVMEACGGAHHWGRFLGQLGHRVRLIPAQYVKPFVKRAKNDRADAEAISEAASRPTMPSVPVKSAQQQADAMILKHREMLTGQRTQAINALRGHATEFGVIAAKGIAQVDALLDKLASEKAIPEAARAMFARMAEHIAALDDRIAALNKDLASLHANHPLSQRLAKVPGIGPVTAVTLSLTVSAEHFESGRHFAAWLGLTPKEHSTGGKPRLGRISKAGHERLRSLLVVGATAVIRHVRPDRPGAWAWLVKLLERKPRKLAAVALANKMARIVWAMMARGEDYRLPATA